MRNYVLKMSHTAIFSKSTLVILDWQNSVGLQIEDFLSILNSSEITNDEKQNKSSNYDDEPKYITFWKILFHRMYD